MSHHYVIPYRHFSIMVLKYKMFLHSRQKPEKQQARDDQTRCVKLSLYRLR